MFKTKLAAAAFAAAAEHAAQHAADEPFDVQIVHKCLNA